MSVKESNENTMMKLGCIVG